MQVPRCGPCRVARNPGAPCCSRQQRAPVEHYNEDSTRAAAVRPASQQQRRAWVCRGSSPPICDAGTLPHGRLVTITRYHDGAAVGGRLLQHAPQGARCRAASSEVAMSHGAWHVSLLRAFLLGS